MKGNRATERHLLQATWQTGTKPGPEPVSNIACTTGSISKGQSWVSSPKQLKTKPVLAHTHTPVARQGHKRTALLRGSGRARGPG